MKIFKLYELSIRSHTLRLFVVLFLERLITVWSIQFGLHKSFQYFKLENEVMKYKSLSLVNGTRKFKNHQKLYNRMLLELNSKIVLYYLYFEWKWWNKFRFQWTKLYKTFTTNLKHIRIFIYIFNFDLNVKALKL